MRIMSEKIEERFQFETSTSLIGRSYVTTAQVTKQNWPPVNTI
jgi:hypothetical protein